MLSLIIGVGLLASNSSVSAFNIESISQPAYAALKSGSDSVIQLAGTGYTNFRNLSDYLAELILKKGRKGLEFSLDYSLNALKNLPETPNAIAKSTLSVAISLGLVYGAYRYALKPSIHWLTSDKK